MTIYRLPVNISWNGIGSPGANVWHFRTAGEITGDSIEFAAAVSAIRTFYASIAAGNVFAPGVVLSAEFATAVETQEQRDAEFTTLGTGGAGTEAPEVLQICVGWRTSLAARRGRGRTFIGPLSTATMESNGSIAEGVIASVNSAAQGLVDASTGAGGWSVGVYGLSAPGGGPTAPRVLRDIVGHRVRDRFAILRSRRD